MPISKKRKKKNQKPSMPPPKGGRTPQKKLTKQRILLYVISAVMIISLAASFVIAGGGHTGVQPNAGAAPQTSDGNNLLTNPQPVDASHNDQGMEAEEDSAVPEEDDVTETETEN